MATDLDDAAGVAGVPQIAQPPEPQACTGPWNNI